MKLSTIQQLLKAKEHSDNRQYDQKADIVRKLVQQKPSEFHIDSEGRGIVGLTHAPTRFKIHLPKEKVRDLDLKKVAQLTRDIRTLLSGAGIGAAGTGLPLMYWYARQQPPDPAAVDSSGKKIRNADVWKTEFAVDSALRKLKGGGFDVPDENNLNRASIPEKAINENALRYLKFEPSIVAVPEHGQDRLMTYRQAGTHAHLHHHPGRWMIHRDRWPALGMVGKEMDTGNKDVLSALGEGLMHPGIEGTRGYLTFIKDWLRGNLTYDEIMKAKTNPEQHPELVRRYNRQLMHENEKILKTLKQEQVKKGGLVPLRVKDAVVNVEIADTDEERTQGLGGRAGLAEDRGMLFTKAGCFWMKDVMMPLDVVFMEKDGTVVDFKSMEVEPVPSQPARLYSSSAPADMALELAGGWAASHGLQPGDRITVAQQE